MNENQYVAFNSIIMNIKTFIIIIISFLSSRYLLQALGVEGFGLYSLIVGVTATLEFIISGITSTTSRYTIMAICKNNLEYSREVFNTIIKANKKILKWFLIVLEVFGMVMILFVLKVPKGFLMTSIIIYQIMVWDTYFKINIIPYNSVLIAKENFLFINAVAILVALIRLGFILLLFYIPSNKVIVYVFLMFILSYFSRFISKKITVNRYNEAYFDRRKYYNHSLEKEILSFLKYSWIGQMASIIKKQGANFLINIFSGGVIYNATYAAANQLASVSDMAFSPLSQTIMPQALKSYSSNNFARFQNLTYFNSKLAIMLSWIFIIPFLLESDFILNIWLKEVPRYTSEILTLVLIDEMIRQLTNGLGISSIIADKIKNIYLLNTILQSVAIFVSIVFLLIGFQFWIIFEINIANTIIFTFINLIFAHKYVKIDFYNYVKNIVVPSLLIGGISIGLLLFFKFQLSTSNAIASLGILTMSFTITFLLFVFFLFNKEERSKILKIKKEILIKIRSNV